MRKVNATICFHSHKQTGGGGGAAWAEPVEDKRATHNATFRAALNMHRRAAGNTPASPQRKFGPFLQAGNFSQRSTFVVFRKISRNRIGCVGGSGPNGRASLSSSTADGLRNRTDGFGLRLCGRTMRPWRASGAHF